MHGSSSSSSRDPAAIDRNFTSHWAAPSPAMLAIIQLFVIWKSNIQPKKDAAAIDDTIMTTTALESDQHGTVPPTRNLAGGMPDPNNNNGQEPGDLYLPKLQIAVEASSSSSSFPPHKPNMAAPRPHAVGSTQHMLLTETSQYKYVSWNFARRCTLCCHHCHVQNRPFTEWQIFPSTTLLGGSVRPRRCYHSELQQGCSKR